MEDLNIHARLPLQEQPTTFKGWVKFVIGLMTGNRKVVKLIGKTGSNEVFKATIGEGKVAKSQKSFQELMANQKLIPIPMKEIHNKADTNNLQPNEIVFVKVKDLAKMKLQMMDILETTKTPDTGLRLIQTRNAIERALNKKVFFETLKDTLVEKCSQPIETNTWKEANALVDKIPKIKLTREQRETLFETRTGDSATIRDNPAKRQDWLNAEEFIRNKADKGEDLTLNDLCILNAFINGKDNEELGGGILRDHAMVLGGFGGLHYLGKDDVRPLMEELVKSISKRSSKGENPIVLAATTYQKMVSIHPFADGNGRTCRLVMDYLLMRAGLPPASLTGNEIIVAIFGEQGKEEYLPEKQTPTTAVKKVIAGVQRTIEKLKSKHPKPGRI